MMNHEEVKAAVIGIIQKTTEVNTISVSMSRLIQTIDNGEFVENKQGPGKITIEIYLPA